MFAISSNLLHWTLAIQLLASYTSAQTLVAQALGSGEIVNSNSASGGGIFGLALTLGGVAGDGSSSLSSTSQPSLAASTLTPVAVTAPSGSPVSGIGPLPFEGTGTTRPLAKTALSSSNNGVRSNYLPTAPWKAPTVSAKATGILWATNSPSLLMTTGSSVKLSLNSGVSGAAGLASTGQPSASTGRNGSWTFSKSGMTIAPTLPSQTSHDVSTRVQSENPTLTETVTDNTTSHVPQTSTDYLKRPTDKMSDSSHLATKMSTRPVPVSTSNSSSSASFTGAASTLSEGLLTWTLVELLLCTFILQFYSH